MRRTCRRPRSVYHEQALMMQRNFGQERGRRGRLFAVRPAVRIRAEPAQERAEDRRGAPGLGQAEPEPLHLCAARQFRPGLDLPDGHALHPRRQGPERSDERAGTRPGPISRSSAPASTTTRPAPTPTMKELGEGTRDVIVSHLRLGHQPARARHRAEGGRGLRARRHALDSRHAVHVHPQGRAGRQDRGAAER